jgi:hypothetical protein
VIPFPIRHGGDQMISLRRPRPVVARRNRTVFVVINKSQCVQAVTTSTRGAAKIEVRAAGGSKAKAASISFTSKTPSPWRIPAYCGKADPNSVLTVSPFVPTVRAALYG